MTRPTLFSLLAKLSAEERQKFGEHRRRLKKMDGVREELVKKEGEWRLAYFRGKEKLEELRF